MKKTTIIIVISLWIVIILYFLYVLYIYANYAVAVDGAGAGRIAKRAVEQNNPSICKDIITPPFPLYIEGIDWRKDSLICACYEQFVNILRMNDNSLPHRYSYNNSDLYEVEGYPRELCESLNYVRGRR